MSKARSYYYTQFRKDFHNFWQQVPHRNNYVTSEPVFKYSGLIKDTTGRAIDPLNRGLDSLKDIDSKNYPWFLSALACTILIDQVMFTHFPEDYHDFQKITQYPKMRVGWINDNPWHVLSMGVRMPRQIGIRDVKDSFREFSAFFVEDLKDFFEERSGQYKTASWESVRKAMLTDSDVTSSDFGEIFRYPLLENFAKEKAV